MRQNVAEAAPEAIENRDGGGPASAAEEISAALIDQLDRPDAKLHHPALTGRGLALAERVKDAQSAPAAPGADP